MTKSVTLGHTFLVYASLVSCLLSDTLSSFVCSAAADLSVKSQSAEMKRHSLSSFAAAARLYSQHSPFLGKWKQTCYNTTLYNITVSAPKLVLQDFLQRHKYCHQNHFLDVVPWRYKWIGWEGWMDLRPSLMMIFDLAITINFHYSRVIFSVERLLINHP